jgi:hypothetical protein
MKTDTFRSLALALVLAWSSSCSNQSATGGTATPVTTLDTESPTTETIITPEESPGSPLQPQLIRTLRSEVILYKRPSSDATVLGNCSPNTLLKYKYQKTNEVKESDAPKPNFGHWLYVSADDPRTEGWIFEITDGSGPNLEWMVDAALQKKAIDEGWNIAHLDRWSNEEIDQAIEIQGVPAIKEKYSGYYCFHRSEEKVDAMNGPFHVVGQDRDLKIEIKGEYNTGMPVADFVAVRTRDKVLEVIVLMYDGRSLSCGGRKYTRSEDGRQTREEYDYNCSFDFSDFSK